MKITVEGVSCLGSFGCGREDFARAFTAPPVPDASYAPAVLPQADVSVLAAFMSARSMRQLDHFTRLALIGAYTALEDAALTPEDMRYAGIVLATGYGPAQPTFTFLDSIEEYGAQMASPLAFSHSVHNIPAATVALKLGMAGPCSTICQFESSVAAGLLTAATWLQEGRVSRVLFGAVDEYTPILRDVTAGFIKEKHAAAGGEGERRALPLGEGAAFLCLSVDAVRPAHGYITGISLRSAFSPRDYAHLLEAFLAEGPHVPETRVLHSGSLGHLPRDEREKSVKRAMAYGNMPVAPAFDILAALDESTGCASPSGRTVCASYSPAGAFSAIALNSSEPGAV